jgi:leucyl aminopeptidase (aminopeptidase T)
MKASAGERLLVVSDDVRLDVGRCFAYAGVETGLLTRLLTLQTKRNMTRRDLPDVVKDAIASRPDLVVNCLRGSADETPFRIKLIHLETKDKNCRLGHCPGITLDMLTEGALALSLDEHEGMNQEADRIITATEGAEAIRVSSPSGTSLSLSIKGRGFFKDTTITNAKWGNLPTGEVTVGPIENSLEGALVCDVAVGGIGLVSKPLAIECHNGRAMSIRGDEKRVVDAVEKTLGTDKMASIVGEMAIGLNQKARIVHEFLETEKLWGTAHIAFGRNTDFPTGGKNSSANHMDFLINKPTVEAVFPSGELRKLVTGGRIAV